MCEELADPECRVGTRTTLWWISRNRIIAPGFHRNVLGYAVQNSDTTKFLANGFHGKRLAPSPMPTRSASCPPCQRLSANFGEQKLFEIETLFVLETNIDDMSPQVLAFTMEELLASGGLDVWAAPVLMKKNRSGTILGVICNARCAKNLPSLFLE